MTTIDDVKTGQIEHKNIDESVGNKTNKSAPKKLFPETALVNLKLAWISFDMHFQVNRLALEKTEKKSFTNIEKPW